VAKRRVGKYPKAFRKMAVERLKGCANIVALSEELGVHRRLLYKWRCRSLRTSFVKTLKREEIYANEYRDLNHLRENIAAFIDSYYNCVRLHSALAYRPPEEFEQAANPATTSQGATMSFFRHEEIFRSDV
jgi:hypothetical protein